MHDGATGSVKKKSKGMYETIGAKAPCFIRLGWTYIRIGSYKACHKSKNFDVCAFV